MRNAKSLIIISLLPFLLMACGMTGPLYHPVTEPIAEKESAVESQSTKETAVDDIQDKQQPAIIRDSESTAADIAQAGDIVQAGDAASIKTVSLLVENEPNKLFTASSQLLAIAPSHFTLQLSAMASTESLQQFAVKHKLPQKNVYIYQTTHNNKPWYVVIYGEYESKVSAERASETLPCSFANMETWIKKYQLVHQDLQLNLVK